MRTSREQAQEETSDNVRVHGRAVSPTVRRSELQQRLGLVEATTLVVGGIIGASIFLVPAAVASAAGHPVIALLVWVLAGLLAACAAFCFAELGSSIPATGGTYVHLRRAYRSDLVAYCFGWMMLFGYGSAAVAVVAIMASSYLTALTDGVIGASLADHHAAALIIVAAAAINIAGVSQGGRAQVVLTAVKLALIATLVLIPLFAGEPDLARVVNVPPPVSMRAIATAIADGLVLCLFAYSGAHFVTHVAGEMRRPRKDIPRAILFGFALVMIAYLALNATYLVSLPFDTLRASNAVGADLMRAVAGESGARLVSLAIVISALAVLNAQLMSYPRIVFALASDGLLPGAIASVHAKTRTPWVAILILASCAVLYVLWGGYREILGAVAFVSHLFTTLAVGGVILLRVREPSLERPYKTPLYPLTPLLFIAVSGAYLCTLIATRPRQSLVGVAIVAVGIPFYMWRKRVMASQQRAPQTLTGAVDR